MSEAPNLDEVEIKVRDETRRRERDTLSGIERLLNEFLEGFKAVGQFTPAPENRLEHVWILIIGRSFNSLRWAYELLQAGYYSQAFALVRSVEEDWLVCKDCDAMVQTTLKTFGRIDVLINNAGGAPAMDEVRNCSVDDFDRTMALNVRGVFLGCKAVLPTMIAQRSGVIVNVTAKAGQQIMVPGDTLYGAAKAAIDRFSIGLGNEVEEYGISVVACSPGRVKTEMSRKRRSDMDLAAYREPEEVARVFVWLAQQTAQTFTMQVVNATEFGESWGPGK